MSGMTGHIATAAGTPDNCAYPSRAAATHNPSSRSSIERQERGMLFAPRVSSPVAPAFLARVRRIEDAQKQWAAWRSLPLQAKRNWLTTKFYLARCEALRARIQTRDVVRSWDSELPGASAQHPPSVGCCYPQGCSPGAGQTNGESLKCRSPRNVSEGSNLLRGLLV